MTFGRILTAAALLAVVRARNDDRDRINGIDAETSDDGKITFRDEESETNCRTPIGGGGQCISINQCDPLMKILGSKPTQQQSEYLRRSVCGYNGNTPKVCCPVQETLSANSCRTPDGQPGTCINLYDCQPILQPLQAAYVPQEVRDNLMKSKCNGPSHHSVCCPSATPAPPPDPEPAQSGDTCVSTATLPEPGGGCCGVEGNSGNRIFGGNETGIDQYPWMALIEYTKDGGRIKLLCGGALVSGRYVLTAGHCVAGDVLRLGRPTSVRLGEYDTTTADDCVPADGGGEDCSDPPVSVPVQSTIAHPLYKPDAANRRNDIALIRLAQLAPYTDFIRPICLPRTDETLAPGADFKLRAAGWGATNGSTSSSNRKLHVELPYKTLKECQAQYSQPRRNIPLWTKQVCAGGIKDKDTCKGDSGGPLMYERNTTWEVIGVVSFGTTPCGMEGVPGVYSKVYEYLDWIRAEVRP